MGRRPHVEALSCFSGSVEPTVLSCGFFGWPSASFEADRTYVLSQQDVKVVLATLNLDLSF